MSSHLLLSTSWTLKNSSVVPGIIDLPAAEAVGKNYLPATLSCWAREVRGYLTRSAARKLLPDAQLFFADFGRRLWSEQSGV